MTISISFSQKIEFEFFMSAHFLLSIMILVFFIWPPNLNIGSINFFVGTLVVNETKFQSHLEK